MKREEFIEKWGASMGHGFTDEELSADLDSLSLPPAEGAEAFIRAKIADHKLHECYPTFVPELAQVMTEFAAQPQPTAEGAEEILRTYWFGVVDKRLDLPKTYDRVFKVTVAAMKEFATLHAQKIADKMVKY